MPALETYDWFKKEVWSQVDDEVRKYLEDQREYLLNIRNENERQRFTHEVMDAVKRMMKKTK
ncbi:MAG: hypothetical protein HYW57_03730 [Ignavibacteriales bacterium]|nr:hypothetical protein [Ignavibacteriales bacterium]